MGDICNATNLRPHVDDAPSCGPSVATFDAQHAEAVDQFYRKHLNPCVNLHRPCAMPKIVTEPNRKRGRVYERWATPFELFREVLRGESYLRPHITLAELDRLARFEGQTAVLGHDAFCGS